MQLHQIREARAAKVQEARSLLASTPQLNAEGQAKFDKLKSEITALEADEQRAQFIEDAERRSLGQPVDKARNELEGRISVVDAIAAHAEQRSLSGALAEYNAEQKRQGVQAKGVLITIVWSAVVAFVAFKLVDLVIGLRVTEEEEREGLDITTHGETAYGR